MHCAIDDHSRLAYSEIHPDERAQTRAGFLQRAAAWFAAHGIDRIERVMTDNAWAYRWLEAGVHIEAVSTLLGHADIRITGGRRPSRLGRRRAGRDGDPLGEPASVTRITRRPASDGRFAAVRRRSARLVDGWQNGVGVRVGVREPAENHEGRPGSLRNGL